MNNDNDDQAEGVIDTWQLERLIEILMARISESMRSALATRGNSLYASRPSDQ